MIDVVWCDFGGVLTPPIDEAVASIVEASGVPWPVLREAADAVAAELGLSGLRPLELGRLTQREWGARVTAALAPGHVPGADLGRWGDHWYRDRAVNVELLGELQRLAGEGTRIGLLTNSVAEWESHRERMLAKHEVFAGYVRSHEIALAKPDPRIFVHADTVLPPRGGTVVLIDDLLENTAAAERHGWAGIRHTETTATITRLRGLAAGRLGESLSRNHDLADDEDDAR